MKYVVSRVTLDLGATSSPLTLTAKQGDSVREIIVGFTNNGSVYPLEDSCTVVFTAEKPSGAKIFNECTFDGNNARYKFTAQTVSEIGAMKCEFKIFDDMTKPPKLTSPRFMINVEEPVFNDGDVPESSYEFNAISDVVKKIALEYLEAHPAITDKTLTIEDNAADAKAVGDEIKKLLPKSGGTMTGPVNMNGQPISGLNAPTQDTHAANKGYVDAAKAEAGAYTDAAKAEAKSYTDAAKAEANAYTDGRHITKTATITTTWSGSAAPYTQAVTVSGILASDLPHITPVYSTTNATAIAQKEAWACVSKAVTAADKLTFTCFEDKPATEIPIQIEVIR